MSGELDYFRGLFPVTERYVYLNHAAIAPISLRVAQAVKEVLSESLSAGGTAYTIWSERIEECRKVCGRLLGACAFEIAFVANTSDALAAVATGLKLKCGDRVLVSVPDFPTVIYPWYPLRKRGIEIVRVERRNGRLTPEDVEAALCTRSKILALSSVDFLTGFACDLEAMGDLCHRKGLLFCVDAIQGLGALPMDVKRYKIHFLGCGSHKWLLGPVGCGILYVSDEVRDEISPERVGWKSVPEEEDFFSLKDDVKPGAQGFEAGSPNIYGVLGLGAAVNLLIEVGIERVTARIMELTAALIDGLRSAGFSPISPVSLGERSGIVSFYPHGKAGEIAKVLLSLGIVVSERGGLLRVSPHFYNTLEEIDRFIASVSGQGKVV